MRPAIFLSCLVLAAIHVAVSCSPPEFSFAPPAEASRCNDEAVNGLETDMDCGGGDCGRCRLGRMCNDHTDCELGSCVDRRCQAAHCIDQIAADGESDVDCGGGECGQCGVNQRCTQALDCRSNSCVGGRCVATGCDDLELGGAETDLDCGGGTCPGCRSGKSCNTGDDCDSGVCDDGVCSTAECVDGTKSAGEEGVDCGGQCPKPCDPAGCFDDPVGCQPNVSTGGSTGQGGAASAGGDTASGGSIPVDGGAGGAGSEAAGGSGGGAEAGGSFTTGGTATGGSTTGGQVTATGGSSSATGGASTGGKVSIGGTASTESCPGCANLSVPLAAADHRANFVVVLPTLTDLRSAVITLRVLNRAGSGGQLRPFVQHGSPDYFAHFQPISFPLAASSEWQSIVWTVADGAGGFDLAVVSSLGVQVTAAGSSQWSNPTKVYLDSITVSGADVGPWNFSSSPSIAPQATTDAAPNVMWLNGNDNPVTGSAISWLGP